MVQSQYCLSWESHKTSICNGLSALQQSGEFVDMTIAADGHYVKVHQMIMALASPYLKELITSAPCQHPVIFLNNVSHRSLCHLLEYIYTGEAMVAAETLSSFLETAKALHIKGLEHMRSCEIDLPVKMALHVTQSESNELNNSSSSTADKMEQMRNPLKRKIVIKPDTHSSSGTASKTLKTIAAVMEHYADDPDNDSDNDQQYTTQNTGYQQTQASTILDTGNANDKSVHTRVPTNLQFTVSIRGSLQIILNRYMYNLHSLTSRTGVRRWRCVDYRNHKCLAFVVTQKNIVLSRGNLHNHPFHDRKILAKIEKNAVYSALDEVQGYKDKEPTEDSKDDTLEEGSLDDEQYLSLHFSDNESEAIMKT